MKKIIRLFIFVLIFAVTHSFWMPYVSAVLQVPDRLEKADCIFVLRGDDYFRFEKAAQLQKQGWAPAVATSVTLTDREPYNMDRLITGVDKLSDHELILKYFEYFKLEPSKVIFTSRGVSSTFMEAGEARRLFDEQKFHSMILVTSGYHMRRALWLFHEAFRGTGVVIYPVTAGQGIYEPRTWWRKERDVRALEAEYGAFLFNFFYHFVFKKTVTSFDTV